MWRFLLISTILSAAATGCDPVRSVVGTVSTTPSLSSVTEDVYQGSSSLEGAVVEYHCPDQEPRLLITSDDAGQLYFAEVARTWSEECEIHVSKDGYHTQKFRVRELCLGKAGSDRCFSVLIQAELARRGVR